MKYEIEFECPYCGNYNHCEDYIEVFLNGYKAQCEECDRKYKLHIIIDELFIDKVEEIEDEGDQ